MKEFTMDLKRSQGMDFAIRKSWYTYVRSMYGTLTYVTAHYEASLGPTYVVVLLPSLPRTGSPIQLAENIIDQACMPKSI